MSLAGSFSPISGRYAANPYFLRLKNSTSCSCFLAASRVLNVPRFRRLPVFGSFFTEYRRYLPDLSLRIILTLLSLCPIFRTLDGWRCYEVIRLPAKHGM